MRAHPCFAADARVQTLDGGNRAVLVVRREKENGRLTALMNFSGESQRASLADGTSYSLEPYEMKVV